MSITLIEIKYDSIGYRPTMLRGMDVLPTLCYYNTQGRGRVVMRHTPHVVVMAIVGFLLGEARSTINLRLLLLGYYVASSIKPTSTLLLAKEG